MVAHNELTKNFEISEGDEHFDDILWNESGRFSRIKCRKIPSHKLMAAVMSQIKSKENNNLS